MRFARGNAARKWKAGVAPTGGSSSIHKWLSRSDEASTRSVAVAEPLPRPLGARLDRFAGPVFIMPAVLVILAFSIFPLLASLYVSLSRLSFSEGGARLTFVGLGNYRKLLVGVDSSGPNKASLYGTSGAIMDWTFSLPKDITNWMIRARYSK